MPACFIAIAMLWSDVIYYSFVLITVAIRDPDGIRDDQCATTYRFGSYGCTYQDADADDPQWDVVILAFLASIVFVMVVLYLLAK